MSSKHALFLIVFGFLLMAVSLFILIQGIAENRKLVESLNHKLTGLEVRIEEIAIQKQAKVGETSEQRSEQREDALKERTDIQTKRMISRLPAPQFSYKKFYRLFKDSKPKEILKQRLDWISRTLDINRKEIDQIFLDKLEYEITSIAKRFSNYPKKVEDANLSDIIAQTTYYFMMEAELIEEAFRDKENISEIEQQNLSNRYNIEVEIEQLQKEKLKNVKESVGPEG